VNDGLAVVWVSQEPDELAAADRIVDLGASPHAGPKAASPGSDDLADTTASAARSVPAEEGEALLTLKVAAWTGEPGPFVRNASALEIEVGQRGVTALVGKNGCGKSVALAAAAGLTRSAQVRPIWQEGQAEPPILVGQFPEQQIFSEAIEEELLYAAVRRGIAPDEARARALAALEVLNLGGGFLSRRTWDLSTGEKRMVELVAAMIAPARLAIFDEPTCGLDDTRKFGLAKLVAERSKRGPVMIASQDILWVEGVADKVVDLGISEAAKDAKCQQKNGLTQTCPSP